MQSGESKWITGEAARIDVQHYRAQSCAVLTSATSVIEDNAKMNVRYEQLGEVQNVYPQEQLRQPVRVILDSRNRLSPDLALFHSNSPIIIIGTDLENIHQWPHFVEHIALKGEPGRIDLEEVITTLASRGYNDILVEAGANLAGAFIEQNLINELILYQAPKLLGGDGRNLVEMPSISKLVDTKKTTISELTMVGDDIKIVATLNEN